MPIQIPEVDNEFKKLFTEYGCSSTFEEKDSRPFVDLKHIDLEFIICAKTSSKRNIKWKIIMKKCNSKITNEKIFKRSMVKNKANIVRFQLKIDWH